MAKIKNEHGDLLGQNQPVGACHLDAAQLERGEDGSLRKRGTLAHEDADIAGADRPVFQFQLFARLQPAVYGGSDTRGQPHRRRRGGPVSSSGDHGSERVGLVVLLGLPYLDQPREPGAVGRVGDRRMRGGHAGRALRRGEDAVDRLEQRRHRAEREDERHAPPRQPGLLRAGGKRLARRGEHGAAPRPGSRRSTASRRRRQTACVRVSLRAVAGEEFLRQRADHVPLHRAGVLRLVDQDVVEPAVELVEHPLHRCRGAQQVGGAGDEVVEVERGAARLGLAVALQHRIAEPDQRHGGIEQGKLTALDVEHETLALRAHEQGLRVRMRSSQPLRQQGLARIAVAGEEHAAQRGHALAGPASFERGRDPFGRFDVVGRPGGQYALQPVQLRIGEQG